MPIDLNDLHSNHVKRCAYCGIPISKENDSGWEVFVRDGKTTQPVCAWCDIEHSREGSKLDASQRVADKREGQA